MKHSQSLELGGATSANRIILRLALPATATALLRGTYTMVDAWWCGRLGADALAAFGSASFYVWALIAVSLTASVGIGSRVARATGAQNPQAAGFAARDGLSASFLVATITGAFTWYFAPSLVAFQGVSAEVAEGGVAYLRAIALGAPAYFAHDAADAAFRGSGDTKTPAVVGTFGALLNVALDPIFLFGLGPIPAMGVGGVGVATAILHATTATVLWTVLWRRGVIRFGRPSPAGMLATVKIGVPSATLGVGFSLVYVALTPAVAAFGTLQVAALAVGHRLEAFAYMTNTGFAGAAQALVGQNLGARNLAGARLAAKRTALIASTATGLYTLGMFAFGAKAAGIFTSDPGVITASAVYVFIIAFSIVPQTVEMVLTGAFEGAGNTLPPLVVGIVTHGTRIPLVYLATRSLGLGVTSVWWTITLCSILAGVFMVALFWRRSSRWKSGEEALVEEVVASAA